MDSSGKIIWAHHNEIQTANIKTGSGLSCLLFSSPLTGADSLSLFFPPLLLSEEIDVKDGDRIALPVKDLGSCEIYPQTLKHNPNGRFVVVCGDGEFIIYTALAWRNKSFGSALDFVWASDSNQ